MIEDQKTCDRCGGSPGEETPHENMYAQATPAGEGPEGKAILKDESMNLTYAIGPAHCESDEPVMLITQETCSNEPPVITPLRATELTRILQEAGSVH